MDKIYYFLVGGVAGMALTMVIYGWIKGPKHFNKD